MTKTECLIFSDGFIDIFILKPMIPISDLDCLNAAIRILNDEKNEIEEQLAQKRDIAIKEIDVEINRLQKLENKNET